MDAMEAENLLKKLDRRLQNVEQILPTLPTREEMDARMATREDLSAAIAPLATKAELAAAVAPLATKAELAAAVAPLATKVELAAAVAPLATRAEMLAQFREERERTDRRFDEVSAQIREEGERSRQHFEVVAESLRDDIRLIAEGHLSLERKVDRHVRDADATLKKHDRRITRLEAANARTRRQKGR